MDVVEGDWEELRNDSFVDRVFDDSNFDLLQMTVENSELDVSESEYHNISGIVKQVSEGIFDSNKNNNILNT